MCMSSSSLPRVKRMAFTVTGIPPPIFFYFELEWMVLFCFLSSFFRALPHLCVLWFLQKHSSLLRLFDLVCSSFTSATPRMIVHHVQTYSFHPSSIPNVHRRQEKINTLSHELANWYTTCFPFVPPCLCREVADPALSSVCAYISASALEGEKKKKSRFAHFLCCFLPHEYDPTVCSWLIIFPFRKALLDFLLLVIPGRSKRKQN